MKILITGARGFIGSHLGNELVRRGYDVTGVDNNSNPSDNQTNFHIINSEAHEADVASFDAVFHLAAFINVDESLKFPEKYLQNNVLQTLELLKKLRNYPHCKFIFASSAEIYGSAIQTPMDETHPINPLSPYAVSKLNAEEICFLYESLYKLDITVIRNFNTFGEYQNGGEYGGAISKFKNQALNKDSITVYGSGEQKRDYMHVSQAVEGYILALEKKLPSPINFGGGTSVKIIDIANYISKKFGVPVVHLNPRLNEVMNLQADISKAQSFGYETKTDFWKQLEEFLSK